MKIALMQPYFFPYIGYYQLAHSVDEFIFYDDANFIKQGFINRNAILLNTNKFEFSLPVNSISSYRKINDHQYTGKFSVFLKQLHSAYAKSPNFKKIIPLIEHILTENDLNVAKINSKTIIEVFSYLGISRKFSFSSSIDIDQDIRSQDRVIEVCKKKQAANYHNSIGGLSLYDQPTFSSAGLTLNFIKTKIKPYPQGKTKEFQSHLSIIDILMWCGIDKAQEILQDYEIEIGK